MKQYIVNTSGINTNDPVAFQKKSIRIAFIYGVIAGSIVIGVIWSLCSYGHFAQQDEDYSEYGYTIENSKLNDIIEWLAKKKGLQYIHNPVLDDSSYYVNGHMNPVDRPLDEIRKLAMIYNLEVKIVGDTLYILTAYQLNREPWNKDE